MITVLVCGGRKYDGVLPALNSLHAERPIGLVVHGGAGQVIDGKTTGADEQAGLWAKRNEVNCLRVPAKWRKYGKRAGPFRNGEMLDLPFKVDLVVAFPGGYGTANMVKLAKEAGISVMEIPT